MRTLIFTAIFFPVSFAAAAESCQPPSVNITFNLSSEAQSKGSFNDIVDAAKGAVEVCKAHARGEKTNCENAVNNVKSDLGDVESSAGTINGLAAAGDAAQTRSNEDQAAKEKVCTDDFQRQSADCKEAINKTKHGISNFQASNCDPENKATKAKQKLEEAEDLASSTKEAYNSDVGKFKQVSNNNTGTRDQLRDLADRTSAGEKSDKMDDSCVDCKSDAHDAMESGDAKRELAGSGPVPIQFLDQNCNEQTYYSSANPESLANNQKFLAAVGRGCGGGGGGGGVGGPSVSGTVPLGKVLRPN